VAQFVWLSYFLFLAYAVFFLWAFPRTPFVRRSGLTAGVLRLVLALHMLGGWLLGIISSRQGQVRGRPTDTWKLHNGGLEETAQLLKTPGHFFAEIFHDSNSFDRFLSSRDSWWNDLHSTLFLKLLGILNLFTNSFYYGNMLFFALLSAVGAIALYRVFRAVFPGQLRAVFAGSLLLPSAIYWNSGNSRDCLICFALTVSFYACYRLLHTRREGKHFALLLISWLLLLIFRNYVLLLTLPAQAAWMISARSRRHPVLVFGTIYFLGILLFFNAQRLSPRLNLMRAVVEKQEDFLVLRGNSRIEVPKLEPAVGSFFRNAGHALKVGLLRPAPGDVRNTFSFLACLEQYGILLLFCAWLLVHSKLRRPHPFVVCCLFFSFSLILLIGYTVNFLGAVVRYRSLILPLLVTPLLATIDWNKIRRRHI
jgi:hypothetical protein